MILHGYFRSTASWRVRIGLAIKGLNFEQVSHHLRKGEQRAPAYLKVNPQGLVPSLVLDDGTALTQSLAILEYLEEVRPEPPMLPTTPAARARVRAAAQIIVCDVHPVQNLKVLDRILALSDEAEMRQWARAAIEEGLDAFARSIATESGPFSFGSQPTLADICLVPQLVNARRFGANWDFGRIAEIEAACLIMPAFASTRPDIQPDAE
jgi:maleylpyruvate isomerase